MLLQLAAAATYQVNTTADIPVPGKLNFRQALTLAGPGDVILFHPVVFPGGLPVPSATIQVLSQLPSPAGGVYIKGEGRVLLSGAAAGAGVHGLQITTDGNTITGMYISGFAGDGIRILDAEQTTIGSEVTAGTHNTIVANGGSGISVLAVGTAASGTVIREARIGYGGAGPDGNCGTAAGACAGIRLSGSVVPLDGTWIEGNVIVGTKGNPALSQGSGILLSWAQTTTVTGNHIGVLLDGETVVPNEGHGVAAVAQVAGGLNALMIEDNVVSGNERHGLLLGQGSDGAIVAGNLIGVTATGDAALGNGGHGVSVFGADSVLIDSNVISANARSGISLAGSAGGDWHSDGVILGNLVGTDVSGTIDLGNTEHGITSAGMEGNYQIGGALPGDANLVSGNGRNGIHLSDGHHRVDGNFVGMDLTGALAIPNGTDATETWAGVLIQALDIQLGTDAPNLISGNTGYGVWVRDPGDDSIVAVEISNNLVGTDALGVAAVGNGSDGIRVEAGYVTVGGIGAGNLIAGNGGNGVYVGGNETWDTSDVAIVDNDIGSGAGGTGAPGNAGSGVKVEQDGTDLSVWLHEVSGNRIYGNGAYGVHLTPGVRLTRLSQNSVSGNALCALELDGANDDVPPPKVTEVTSGTISGTLDPTLNGFVDSVEVYADEGGEALDVLGTATVVGNAWSLAGSFAAYDFFDIRALVIVDFGDTSELTETCGDGCAVASHALCDDHNDCTGDWCDPLAGCDSVPREAGWPCEDGDLCTGTPDDPDTCDGLGGCDTSDTDIDPANEDHCPWGTGCNLTTCDPDKGCVYAHVCGDGVCAPDDLDTLEGLDAFGEDCTPCAECVLPDTDGDGLPDSWEQGGYDAACDGVTPLVPIPGALVDVPQVFLEIDYMATDCANPVSPEHSHEPDPDELQELIDAYEAEGFGLLYEVDDCIPEVPLLNFDLQPHDPDCTAADWAQFDDLKRLHFTKERRGVYHYAIIGHSNVPVSVREWVYEVGDGVCQGSGQGQGEFGGDDLRITKQSLPDGLNKPVTEATSLMHEIGHNHGLLHGGPSVGTNHKPNYQSIMNYRYEFKLSVDDGAGLSAAVERNFSREALPLLSEAALVEADGVLSYDARYLVTWTCPEVTPLIPRETWTGRSTGDPIDWDCDGAEAMSAVEVDASGNDGIQADLAGMDDWSALNFAFQCADDGGFQDDRPPTEPLEPDWSEEEAARAGMAMSVRTISIDIVPSCAANPVLVGANGTVEVALLGEAGLDLDEVIPASLRFQGAWAGHLVRADVNGDSVPDLRLRFETADLRANAASAAGRLTGRLVTDQLIEGRAALTPYTTLPDADADGVSDPCDACPDTPPGTPAGDDGCAP